jgi:hypothetical protein
VGETCSRISLQHTLANWSPILTRIWSCLKMKMVIEIYLYFNFKIPIRLDKRHIGDKPLGKDLNNAVFSPSSKFNPHQMVLVPRSKGGFTYGRIVKVSASHPCLLLC